MSTLTDSWRFAQKFETDWWGTCANSFSEEVKQITYAHRMGLQMLDTAGGKWPLYDMEGRSVVDLGGGPVSILLKCINVEGTVVDPAEFPPWVYDRYAIAGIDYRRVRAEEVLWGDFDECWIYNVLQHTISPAKVIENALNLAKTVRVFEWVDIPPYLGHLHQLSALDLDSWLGINGTVEEVDENGMRGRAYHGVK